MVVKRFRLEDDALLHRDSRQLPRVKVHTPQLQPFTALHLVVLL